MADQVPVAHRELRLQILKAPARPRGQQRHDAQPTLLVDRFVELPEIDHAFPFGGQVQAA